MAASGPGSGPPKDPPQGPPRIPPQGPPIITLPPRPVPRAPTNAERAGVRTVSESFLIEMLLLALGILLIVVAYESGKRVGAYLIIVLVLGILIQPKIQEIIRS